MSASEAAIGSEATVASGMDVGGERHFRPPASDKSDGKSRRGSRQLAAVLETAKALWKEKLAPNIRARTRISKRQAERLAADRCGISGPVLAGLITSEEGFAFVEALMAASGKPPTWWAGFKHHVEAAQYEADIAVAKQLLKDSRNKRNGLVARRT